MRIHNTLTREKSLLSPLKAGKVGLYACGVTVYDHCHLGHARTYAAVDVAVRYLRFMGLQVNYVRNITDIDDKIIKRANERGEEYHALTARFIQAMHEDFKALSFIPPDHEPRATDYIPKMIDLIQTLLHNHHAYIASNGDVYFDVRSFSQYGALSHHDLEQLESGIRVEVSEAKRDPLDFVLWKLAKSNEPAWDSPFGQGRPGWHIECSTMSMQLLGEHFDIHAGGRDLIFPHHENEIAQSTGATGQNFANIWMHAGFLQIDKEKMSKSLGNFITIREALKDHTPEILRYFLIASHYRSPLIYTEAALLQSKQSLTRLYNALRFLPDAEPVANTAYETQFREAMADDFNVPIALSVLFELTHEIQRQREDNLQQAAGYGALLKQLGQVLGLLYTPVEQFFQSGSSAETEKIEALIAARQTARAQKDWAEADRIREALSAMGITIEDSASGTTWKKG
jgi:cysteinyl-tRNA synthetase